MDFNSQKLTINHAVLDQGFLDLKVNNFLPAFREQNKEEYTIINDLIHLFNSLEHRFDNTTVSPRDIFLLSCIIELNRLFQSAVLLFERGIPASANIIIRTILELSLNIVEIIKNEDYIQSIIFSEIYEARKTINHARDFNQLTLIPQEKICEIQEIYNSFPKYYPQKLNMKQLAEKNNFKTEYLLYRTYCSNTHTSASTLAKNFNISSKGMIFDAGIQLGDFKNDVQRLISIAIIPLPSLINDYFCDDNLNTTYDLINENLNRYFAKNSDCNSTRNSQ